MKEKNKKLIIPVFLAFIGCLLLSLTFYVRFCFGYVSFEQVLYSLIYSEGTSKYSVIQGCLFCFISTVISLSIIIICYRLLKKFFNNDISLFLKVKNKEFKFELFTFSKKRVYIFSISYALISLIFVLNLFMFFDYFKGLISTSTFVEDNYVNPKSVDISFPLEKQNLIYIFVESLENSFVSSKNGGYVSDSYIPDLEKLALNNINFSNTDKIGGALSVNGTGWTAAAMISQTSGLHLKLSIDGNQYSNISASFPGSYNLGDILYDNGYNNYLMLGSDADYGGRKEYFVQHGNYQIYDYHWAIETKKIPSDYKEWWGYEDSKLFKFAKEKLLEIAEDNEPFNFTILTADTHFIDGYIDKSCKDLKFDSRYANSFYCSDSKINSFINWIRMQDFYENTTIIITGDHLTMQNMDINYSYTRSIYNAFINSKVNPIKTNNRLFSSLDYFPTTLAALGCKIEGDRLGLGTNLFSDKKTILEEFGFDYVNLELNKRSNYYNHEILSNSYYELQTRK